MSRGHCLGFEPCRSGDSQTQVGSISRRSQEHEPSLFGEVMKKLVFRLVSDGQIFLIKTTENMLVLGAMKTSRENLVKRNTAADLFKRENFSGRLIDDFKYRVFTRPAFSHCDTADRFGVRYQECTRRFFSFWGGLLDSFKLSGFDRFAKEVQNLLGIDLLHRPGPHPFKNNEV